MIKYIFDNVIFLCFLPKCVVCDWRGGMGGGQRFEQLMYFYHWQFTEFSSRHWGSSSWTIWIWTIPGLHTWAVWPIARFWACQSEPGWLSGSSPDCLSCTEYRWPGRIVNIHDCSKTFVPLRQEPTQYWATRAPQPRRLFQGCIRDHRRKRHQ